MDKKAEDSTQMNKRRSMLRTIPFILFIGILSVLTVLFAPAVTKLVRNPDEFRRFIDSYGTLSILVFIGFQILQVIIAAIPGELVQIAGGYIFGVLEGTLYSVIGILIGAIAAFCSARLLGFKAIASLISKTKIDKFNFLLNNRKGEMIIFLLFLIPGLPKDILVYIAGLSPIKPLRFFVIYLVARLPGLVGSSMIGAHIQQKNYVIAIAIFALASVLFMIGFLFRDKIIESFKRDSSD